MDKYNSLLKEFWFQMYETTKCIPHDKFVYDDILYHAKTIAHEIVINMKGTRQDYLQLININLMQFQKEE